MRSRRLTVVVAMAVMGAMMVAMAGMVQAQPVAGAADAKCLDLARQTLEGFGADINPSNTTFVGGTEGDDDFTGLATEGKRDVFCGFGGNDSIVRLDEGDIFLGGQGDDLVEHNYGTVYGGAGNDEVGQNHGTFYGGEGDENIFDNFGTFYGGEDSDQVYRNRGTFYGGAGNDMVFYNYGTFYGGEGNYDRVVIRNYGTFIQD